MTIKINKPAKELVTPTPSESADPINSGFAQPVFTDKSVIEKGEQVGVRTVFACGRTPEDVSIPRSR